MAARAAQLLGAERVLLIDRFGYRLRQAESKSGVETINYSETSVDDALLEATGGRGPDVCIEAAGCEAHSTGPQYVYDQVKSKLKLEMDRPIAVREAIYNCRKGGSVFVLGVFTGLVDKLRWER
jgi:threonine dehydrogenase-like Zn-dependent dehydrogenase